MLHNQDMESNTNSNVDEQNREFIKLKVVGNDNNEIYYRVKMSTPMFKVKKSYSERVGIPVNSLLFLYDGNNINDCESPITLEMSNEAIIEVYERQTGG